ISWLPLFVPTGEIPSSQICTPVLLHDRSTQCPAFTASRMICTLKSASPSRDTNTATSSAPSRTSSAAASTSSTSRHTNCVPCMCRPINPAVRATRLPSLVPTVTVNSPGSPSSSAVRSHTPPSASAMCGILFIFGVPSACFVLLSPKCPVTNHLSPPVNVTGRFSTNPVRMGGWQSSNPLPPALIALIYLC